MELPPRPDSPLPGGLIETRSASNRKLVAVAAVMLAAVGAVATVAYLSGRGDGFPETVLGYQRLTDENAERAERFMESIRIADLEIQAAVYGEGETPRLVAVVYDNYPAGADIHAIVNGMSSGMEGSGGSVDEASLQTTTAEGYAFACVEAGGPGMLVPGGPNEDGVACVFQGDATGLVITTHSTVSIIGLQDVRAFVEAYGA